MASSPISSTGNPFDVLGQDMSAQYSQLAQYSIQRAASELQNNRKDSAITAFRQALAYDPQNATALTYIGNLNLAQGKEEEAIKAFKDLVKTDPLNSEYQISLGNSYLQAKRYDEAEATFKQAARIDPLNPLPEYTLGMQYMQQDRLSEAESQFKKVQRMAPSDGNVFYALGALYNKQQKYPEAVQELKNALLVKSNFPAANYELGYAYTKLGMTSEATEQLNSLVSQRSSLASDLQFEINRPKMLFLDNGKGNFNTSLGPNTQLWMLDPAQLSSPGAAKTFSVSIQFNTQMDMKSVTSISNWTISRGRNASAGYYNNSVTAYGGGKDVNLPAKPVSIIYNASTMQATVNFVLTQNATGDATVDPKHVVFKFTGMDASGRSMDASSDEIDGRSAFKGF